MRKVFLAALISLAILAAPLTFLPAISNTGPTPTGPVSFTVNGADQDNRSSLAMQPAAAGIGETRGAWIDCVDVYDPACDRGIEGLSGQAVLSPCQSDSQENCVESLNLGMAGQQIKSASLIRETIGGIEIAAAPDFNWIKGGKPSLWQSETPHMGSATTYAVIVKVGQYFSRTKGEFVMNQLRASVIPYREVSGKYVAAQILDKAKDGSRFEYGSGGAGCIWVEDGKCGLQQEFSTGTIASLTLRLPKQTGGWFQGRFKSPELNVEDFSTMNNRVSITAESIQIPTMAAQRQLDNLSSIENLWRQNNGLGNLDGINYSGMDPGDPKIFDYVNHFRKDVDDTIAGTTSVWMLKTTFFNNGTNCYSNKTIQGIISTNALGYDSGAPDFDSGLLTYRVTGLHYQKDGKTPVTGTYDLLLDSAVARCIYGFSKAPISATVTVIGTGDQNIATTIVSEKDGWLKLAAYGFNFSEKKIQVRITQPNSRTLSKFAELSKTLNAKQKAEIRTVLRKSSGNTKLICTGVYLNQKDKSVALSRARAACSYAKNLDKNYSFFSQAKLTKAASYGNKVIISSK